jgi:hypothetical protein
MKFIKNFVVIIICITLFSCGKSRYHTVCKTGILKPQGITTYQYGTHVLEDATGKTLYALLITPDNNVSTFINKNVVISGTFAEGYPVDNGPDFITVISIETK